MAGKWKRRLRIVRRLLLALVGLLVIAVAAVVITLHTDWGREQVRQRIAESLDGVFEGDVEIGTLEGSVFGTLVLRNIVIHDRDGRRAIVIDRVELSVELAPLVRRHLALDEVVATGVEIHGRYRDGRFNLAELVRESDEPGRWSLELDQFVVTDAQGTLDTDRRVDHLDAVTIEGQLSAGSGDLTATLAMAGTWRERDAAVSGRAEVRTSDRGLAIPSAELAIDEARIVATEISITSPQRITGTVSIDVPADAIGTWIPSISTSPALALQVTARPGDADATHIDLSGAIAGERVSGALDLSVTGDQLALAGTLSTTQLDAASFTRSAPETAIDAKLDLDLNLDLSRSGLSMLAGNIIVAGAGRVQDVEIDDLDAKLAIAQGTLTVEAQARGPGDSHARVEARGRLRGDGAIVLERGRVVARASDLARATRRAIDLNGSFEADLDVRGTIDGRASNVTVTGVVTGTNVRYATVSVERVRLELALADVPDRLAGSATASIEGARIGDTPLPALAISARTREDGAFSTTVRSGGRANGALRERIEVDAIVRPRDRGVLVELGRHVVRMRGVRFAGHGGVIDATETRVVLRDVHTTVGTGRLELDGHYRFSAPRAGELAARITARDLDLVAVDRMFGLTGQLAGRVTADLEVRRDRGTIVDATATGSLTDAVAYAGADPIDASFSATLSRSRIVIDANVRGDRIGGAIASFEIVPPRHRGKVAAWVELERAALRRVDLRATDLDLAALVDAMGVATEVTGRVNGHLVVTPTGVRGSLRARAISVPTLPPITAEIELESAARGTLRANARADVGSIGRGTIAATVQLPRRLFDASAWAGLDASAIESLRAEAHRMVIDESLAAWLGLGDLRGVAAIAIDAGPRLENARVAVLARDMIGGPLVRPIGGAANLVVDRTSIRASVRAYVADKPLALAEATVGVGIQDLERADLGALRRARVAGNVHLATTDLGALLALVDAPAARRVRGIVGADASVSGTIEDPVVDAEIAVTDVRLGRRSALRELRIEAHHAAGNLTIAARGRQEHGGELVLDSRVDLARPEQSESTLTMSKLELTRLARIAGQIGVSGTLDGTVTLRGIDPETATLEGRLVGRDVGLPLTDELGALHGAKVDLDLREGRASLRVDGRIESGEVTLRASVVLDGILPRIAIVDLTAREIALITSSAPRVGGILHADVARRDGRWVIDAELSDGRVAIPKKAGRELHETGIPRNMVIVKGEIPPPSPDPFATEDHPTRTSVVMTLKIRPIEITSEQFRGRVDGDLEIESGADGIAITGNVDVVRGDVMLFERRYRIERAAVRFDGSLDPRLDIRLVYDFPQLTLRVAINGRLSDPQLALTSDRGVYTEGQLLGFLVGGSPSDEPAPAKDGAAKDVASAAVAQMLGTYIGKLLPVRIDVLRYEAGTASRSGALTIGRRLSDRLFLSWRSRVAARPDENTGEVSLEYWLSRRVLLDGVVGNEGVHGLDLFWSRRW